MSKNSDLQKRAQQQPKKRRPAPTPEEVFAGVGRGFGIMIEFAIGGGQQQPAPAPKNMWVCQKCGCALDLGIGPQAIDRPIYCPLCRQQMKPTIPRTVEGRGEVIDQTPTRIPEK